jgi:hypothetical protein
MLSTIFFPPSLSFHLVFTAFWAIRGALLEG